MTDTALSTRIDELREKERAALINLDESGGDPPFVAILLEARAEREEAERQLLGQPEA